MMSHETRDIDKCPAYSHDADVIIIKSPSFSLCNYYLCPVKVFNMEFMSSEHAYQWRFLTYLDMPDLALEVLNTSTAGEAKAVASRVPGHLHRDWHKIKSCVMKEILHAKADSCPKFKDTLLNSAGKRLIEAVRGDIFWSSGLSPLFAASTKPQYFPGSNQLGYVLESVRQDLMKEAVLSHQLDIDDCIDFSDFPSESLEVIENKFEVPLPASSQILPTTTHSEGTVPASLCVNADVLPDVPPPSPFQSPPVSPQLVNESHRDLIVSESSSSDRDQPENDASSSDPNPVVNGSSPSHLDKSVHALSEINVVEHPSPLASVNDDEHEPVLKSVPLSVKRKLTPGKNADTAQDNPKLQRGESHQL